MKTLRTIASILITLLGVGHICVTQSFFKRWDLPAIWFAGTGLGFVFYGLFNLLLIGRREPWTRWMGLAANLAGLLFVGLITWKLRAPQCYVSVALTLILTAFSLKRV